MRICGGLFERKLLVSLSVLLAFVLSLAVSGPARAQVAGATLSGTVTDPSGAAIPNAEVTVRDTGKGTITTASTNSDGFYSIPNLQPANYEVTVTAAGFSKELLSNIVLTVGANQTLPVKMKIGEAAQTVTVTESAPIVELSSSQISGEVDSTTVRELPLNGRDWTTLATLQPGVVSDAALQPSASGTNGLGGFARGQRGFGLQLAVNGARPEQNDYRIDGITVNDYANGGPGTALGATIGVEAVQEFSVLTSNYSAQYGRTSGGVINALTKSGTNQFHGDVFEFLRNSAMDARNFFDPASIDPKIPHFERNQFGGAAGGPVIKDKTFFFATYEGFRQNKGVTSSNIVPTSTTRSGLLEYSGSVPGPLCVPTSTPGQCQVAVDPLVAPFLPLWPLPNDGISTLRNTGTYSVTGAQGFIEDFVDARMDHKISDKDSLYGTYQYDHSSFTGPDAMNDVLNGSFTHRQFLALQESHVFSANFLNSVRAGYNRNAALVGASQTALNPLAGESSLGAAPGHNAPVIQLGGVITNFTGGVNSNTHSFPLINSMQGYDDASYNKGNHTIKLGFAAERMQTNITGYPSGGTYNFGGLYQFLTNQPTSFLNAPAAQSPGYAYRQTVLAGYAQDDYRWRPNLTFNIGLRYEISTVPNEAYGKEATLHDPTSGTIIPGEAYFANPTLRNFEPRVGFAWDPFKDGKSSVRAGFGIYDVLPLAYLFYTSAGGPPFNPTIGSVSNPPPVGSFPTGAYALAVNSTATQNMYMQPNPKRNYVMQWNLSVEHQFTSTLAATLTYAGSGSVHNPLHDDDMNQALPTLTSIGYLFPCGPNGKAGITCASGFLPTGTQAAPVKSPIINPTKGRMIGLMWNSSSNYNGLAAELEKRMGHGLQAQVSYTWSHCIDEGSASTYGDQFGNGLVGLPFYSNSARRGACDYNIGQNLVINYTWDILTPKSWHGALGYVSSGWELGSIFTAHTGTPFTPKLSGDPNGEGNTQTYAEPNIVPGCGSLVNSGSVTNYLNLNCFALPTAPASYASQCANFTTAATAAPAGQVYCANLLGNLTRNSVPGPGFWGLDFSAFKNNPIRRISETFNVQFRAELFNVFNHPNFAAPVDNSTVFNVTGSPIATAGQIDQTSADNREIQFAIKVIW